MTLPQHLEPFLLQENPALTLALRAGERAGAEAGAELLLGAVARGTCQALADRIVGACELNHNSCKQLATDIGELYACCPFGCHHCGCISHSSLQRILSIKHQHQAPKVLI